ncbi:NADH-quinone oxidoreductase subunit J, partial [Cutibacterium acnes subsp. acnes]|nr:NADH-quinone oxidoreductase subunit J [Cutibacterium acnes subsp. acnes]
ERMSDRMDAYLNDGAQLASHPAPGVYARSNEIGAPALLPDGTVAQASVSKALASRGGIIDAGELKAPTASAFATISASRREVEGELE